MVSRRGGFDFGGHVGELPLDRLEIADGFAELLALLGIIQRGFVGALGHAERQSGDGDAAAVEHAHGVDESVAFFAQQIFGGNHAVFEDQFRGVAGAQAQLVFFFAGTESLGVFLHDEGGEPVRVGGAIGYGDHDDHIGIVAVGAESLGAVQHPVVALAHGGHAGAAGVGSGRRFGQAPGADEFAGGQLADVFLFLRFVAGEENVVGAERGVRGDDDADRAIHAREFLDGGDVFDVAHAGAAVFRRERRCPAGPACPVP